MKAREFWIRVSLRSGWSYTVSEKPLDWPTLPDKWDECGVDGNYQIHVREVLPDDELSALKSQILKYEEALKYYAAPPGIPSVAIARTVLAEFGKRG